MKDKEERDFALGYCPVTGTAFFYIAGYTPGGAAYGITLDEWELIAEGKEETEESDKDDLEEVEVPF